MQADDDDEKKENSKKQTMHMVMLSHFIRFIGHFWSRKHATMSKLTFEWPSVRIQLLVIGIYELSIKQVTSYMNA